MYERTIAKLVAAGFGAPADFQGASDLQIAAVEARFGGPLPHSYRAFLAQMGRSMGSFLRGSDVAVGWEPPFNAYVDDLEPAVRLASGAFVFLSHQGYSFAAFDADTGDDPQVFVFVEGSSNLRRLDQTFSQWIDRAADDEIALKAKFEGKR